MLRSAAGKVLVIDEAYNLDDNLYGKQARSGSWVILGDKDDFFNDKG